MIKSNKSIEKLENDYWEDLAYDSYVVQTCQKARRKPISQLSEEEIRLLIGQKIGLKYLLPIALSIVKENPFVEITFFEGDLLVQLLRLSYSDWKDNREELESLKIIVKGNLEEIKALREKDNELIDGVLSIGLEEEKDND